VLYCNIWFLCYSISLFSILSYNATGEFMSYQYFQFYFSDAENLADRLLSLHSIIKKESGMIRLSMDLNANPKNMSVLCNSESQKQKWIDFFEKHGLRLEENLIHELLEDHQPFKVHCGHDQGCSKKNLDHHDHHEHHEHHEHHWLKAAIGIISGAGLLLLSILSLNIPMIIYYVITGIYTLITLYLGYKIYQSALRALLHKKWDMSTLYTISTVAIIGLSIASFFMPSLLMMLESAPLILGFWHLGEGIEHTLLDKIDENLDVRDCAPKSALLKTDLKNWEAIPVHQLIPNDVIQVQPGQVIPIDGILNQDALLSTTKIDGSPYIKQLKAGDKVQAGMSLASDMRSVEIQVTKIYQQSYLSLIAKNI
jgi:Cu2+-exporting ATPase